MLLKIVQAGDPVLRRTAQRLSADDIRSESTQRLIALMRETMHDAPGVGLAAPQVGESVQIVVVEDPAELQAHLTPEQLGERQREPIAFHVLINPELTVEDSTPATFLEGCLSVAGFYALVPRALSVQVKALNEQAEPVEMTARGWYARILQHEVDHLNGTLCIDRMHPRSFMTKQNYAGFWKAKAEVEIEREFRIDWGRREGVLEEAVAERLKLVHDFTEFIKQRISKADQKGIDNALAEFEQRFVQ